MEATHDDHDQPRIIPPTPLERFLPGMRPLGTFDDQQETWTIRQGTRPGKRRLHACPAPWLPLSCCAYDVHATSSAWVIEWREYPRRWSKISGTRSGLLRTCQWCRNLAAMPFEGLLAPGFPPPTTMDDALVMADWWEESGDGPRAAWWKMATNLPGPGPWHVHDVAKLARQLALAQVAILQSGKPAAPD